MQNIQSLFQIIKLVINKKFFNTRLYLSSSETKHDHFISINDNNVYYSKEYQDLILEINTKLLWPRKIYNVHFATLGPEEIVEVNFSNVSSHLQNYKREKSSYGLTSDQDVSHNNFAIAA